MNASDTQRWLELSEMIENHYEALEFDKVDELLKTVDLSVASTQDIAGYIMKTFVARNKLQYRTKFIELAEKELMKRPEWKSKDFVEGFRMIARSE